MDDPKQHILDLLAKQRWALSNAMLTSKSKEDVRRQVDEADRLADLIVRRVEDLSLR